jgi:exosome complex exonuclease RRP6
MDPSEFDGYYAQLQASALKATKNAAALPADLAFHRSVDSDLANDLEVCSNKVTSITNMLLDFASTIKSAKGKGKARVRDEDDFLDRFASLIVEPMDQLFERAVFVVFFCAPFSLPFLCQDIALDQVSGRTKAPAIAINPPEPKKKESRPQRSPRASSSACSSSPKTAAQV